MRSSSVMGGGALLPYTLLGLVASSVSAQQFYGGLVVEVTKKAECNRHSKVGDELSMNYRGTLQSDGSQFDSSYGRGPFSFELGAGQVIKGWDMGLVGMCIGEERRLTIPPKLAYGEADMGKIPPHSTLVFETALLAIAGVDPNNDAPPENAPDSGEGQTGEPAQGSQDGPSSEEDNGGKCKLLGPFALLIQGALGVLALMSLVWKRYRETPRRPLKVWVFDVSKQVCGSMLLHLLNLIMSILSSEDFNVVRTAGTSATGPESGSFVQDDRKPNPCSFYLLNLAIDTTIGIPILVLLLRVLHHAFSLTPLAKPEGSLRSGNYGTPPKARWWLKQAMIYFLGLLGMKLCVFVLFELLPWLGWVGDWALRWTEGKEWVQITFVMLIFPLIMNAMQYYIIDSFIKDKEGASEEHGPVSEVEDEEHEGLIGGRRDSEDDEGEEHGLITEESRLKEANPMPLPVEEDKRIGSSSSSSRRGQDFAS